MMWITSVPLFFLSMIGSAMTIPTLLFIFLLNFIVLQCGSWFLLFHLSYYSISHRVDTLTSLIKNLSNHFLSEKTWNLFLYRQHQPQDCALKKLRMCGFLFDQISTASNELTAAFSCTALLNLIILMILCSTSLFFFIFSLASPTSLPDIMKFDWGYLFLDFDNSNESRITD